MTYDKASFLAGLRTGLALPRMPKEKPKTTYLTFLSEDSSEFTLYIADGTKRWNGTLYYSTDAVTWETWNGSTIYSSNGVLHLRGSGNRRITAAYYTSRFVLPTQKRIRCSGNIETLLDWDTVSAGGHPAMDQYCFGCMFSDCSSLISAPELPATILAEYCYEYLFDGCTSLTEAPELPATALAHGCYRGMFRGCTALTLVHQLPAESLTTFCYDGMYSGCTALASVPDLLATTLAESCCENMFRNCTSLLTAPALPATALSSGCYRWMFYGCTSLATPPTLPATVLANECYYYMFYGCTSLLTTPALPAIGMYSLCYFYMFYGCTSLVSVPELPTKNLNKNRCYYKMFYGCTSLKLSATQDSTYQYPYRIPITGDGTGASQASALVDMFANTGGTFVGTPSINTTYYTDHPPVPAEQGGNHETT